MKKCKWYQLHQFETIYEIDSKSFMGETYDEYIVAYKKCKRCGAAVFRDAIGNYRKLTPEETEILNKHIVIDTIKNCLVIDNV